MHLVKIHKVGNSVMVTLPPSVVDALHLHENDRITVKVVEDHIVLEKVSPDFHDAWNVYQQIEPRYREANRRLSE